MASSDTPGGTHVTLGSMSLIEDILMIARHCADKSCPAAPASQRVLSAHANGGLPRAILGQALMQLESRMVELLRRETDELARSL